MLVSGSQRYLDRREIMYLPLSLVLGFLDVGSSSLLTSEGIRSAISKLQELGQQILNPSLTLGWQPHLSIFVVQIMEYE